MRIFDTRLNSGGLFRCCTGAFGEHAKNHAKEVNIGDVVTCPHCQSEIVLESDKVWRWAKNKTPKVA